MPTNLPSSVRPEPDEGSNHAASATPYEINQTILTRTIEQSTSESTTAASIKINQAAPADRTLIEELRAALAAAADPARAPAMQAYMKSALPYYGVPATPLRRLTREVAARHPLPTAEVWQATIRALWREATHREERYAALELASLARYRAFRTRAALPLYGEFVVSGAWWDLVDATAHLLRDLVRDDHDWTAARMREWARDPDPWKRRAAIISQLGLKAATDWPLLQDCIAPNLEDRSFWLRKAIGWALREYARTSPEVVRAYVEELGARLSPLSRREALKHLGTTRAVAAPEAAAIRWQPERRRIR